ncbi:hypothetical protein PF005_g11355 [Phytophthora fragariae]|uniref:Uncharacterized protein n=1 Tax=Phytophthora fragariae TaxID=53985 RepID=A0A6A3EQK9_9STRA|nr:hypothetical protein PF009_g15810 [Phytophthora fragariae]KAE9010345.1 hypothetical protein PF011_g9861 [Phytophthora fragariae]KAE9111248.1 hypothetical protein PF010_g10876 [Phytophthora fragariae]KAE9111260.1 hypothetical protein PF007_g11549 [Phytophthora fragariae]KAE9144421.1 hypothetical protein PF006_g10649 [Phytophthora fragariae]
MRSCRPAPGNRQRPDSDRRSTSTQIQLITLLDSVRLKVAVQHKIGADLLRSTQLLQILMCALFPVGVQLKVSEDLQCSFQSLQLVVRALNVGVQLEVGEDLHESVQLLHLVQLDVRAQLVCLVVRAQLPQLLEGTGCRRPAPWRRSAVDRRPASGPRAARPTSGARAACVVQDEVGVQLWGRAVRVQPLVKEHRVQRRVRALLVAIKLLFLAAPSCGVDRRPRVRSLAAPLRQ